MIDIPEQRQFSTTKPSPYDEFENIIKSDIYEQLLNEFPPEELFKDEFPEERKHGQRPHCRRFFCIGETQGSKYFDDYLLNANKLPPVWQNFLMSIIQSSEYKSFIADSTLFSIFNFDAI